MMGASAAAAGATEMRVWLAARIPPRALKALTVLLVSVGLLVAASVGP